MPETLDSISIFKAQLDTTAANLQRVRYLFKERAIQQFAERLHERPMPSLDDLGYRLGDLYDMLSEGSLLETLWEQLAAIRIDAAEVYSESLALLQGALARDAELDGGLCDAADSLLAELSAQSRVPWARMTILGDEEFIPRLGQVVRLRFPELSVWALPTAAHEFGHVVARELRTGDGVTVQYRYPLTDLIEAAGVTARLKHELFADFFGVFAMGPAFACTSILLHFGPRPPDTAGERLACGTATHPSPAERAYAILAALRRLNDEAADASKPYHFAIETLERAWTGSLEAAGQPARLTDHVRDDLDSWVSKFFAKANRYLDRTRFQGWPRLAQLAPALISDEPPAEVAAAGWTINQVVNAAWSERLEHWPDGPAMRGRLGERALELCRAIATNRPAATSIGGRQ